MKRIFAVVLVLLLCTGCKQSNKELDRAISLREHLLSSNGCTFTAIVTADYGDKIYSFTMDCQADKNGDLTFSVTEPASISGITGTIANQGGHLTFDEKALAFEMIADGQITPVSAPWLFVRTLRSGYISACGADGDYVRASIDDSYQEDALHLDIWLDRYDMPVRAEILWQGRRVVSLEIKNFSIV